MQEKILNKEPFIKKFPDVLFAFHIKRIFIREREKKITTRHRKSSMISKSHQSVKKIKMKWISKKSEWTGR